MPHLSLRATTARQLLRSSQQRHVAQAHDPTGSSCQLLQRSESTSHPQLPLLHQRRPRRKACRNSSRNGGASTATTDRGCNPGPVHLSESNCIAPLERSWNAGSLHPRARVGNRNTRSIVDSDNQRNRQVRMMRAHNRTNRCRLDRLLPRPIPLNTDAQRPSLASPFELQPAHRNKLNR